MFGEPVRSNAAGFLFLDVHLPPNKDTWPEYFSPFKKRIMGAITLEEHVSFPEMTARIPERPGPSLDFPEPIRKKLAEVGAERLTLMDEAGIDYQILSVIGPGADLLFPSAAPAFAAEYNDLLASRIQPWPERFKAFAHLPTTNPEAAADELGRCVMKYGFVGGQVNGVTNGRFLDHPDFAPLLDRAQSLDVPLYLHPGIPPLSVIDAYYSDLPAQTGIRLATSGWGWHSETAIHVLRMIISGTFDRFPRLKLIIGHMGEMLPVMMVRAENNFPIGQGGLHKRTVSEILKEQVWITTSGIFTLPPFQAAVETFGPDRILYSVDYPFSSNEQGGELLKRLGEWPKLKDLIASGNARRLFNLF